MAEAAAHDAADPLAALCRGVSSPRRCRGRKLLYLGGHSLGLQPKSAAAHSSSKSWRTGGVSGFSGTTPPRGPGSPITSARRRALAGLAGALESEVVAMNSLTINLHLMMVSFFRPEAARNSVLIESSAFPSDRYAVVSQLEFHGLNAAEHLIEVEPRAGERTLRTEDLLERIEREGSAPGAGAAAGRAISHRRRRWICRR